MSSYSFLGILTVTLVPAYATYFLAGCLYVVISPFVFPELRKRRAREREQAEWDDRRDRLRREREHWEKNKEKINRGFQQEIDRERAWIESKRYTGKIKWAPLSLQAKWRDELKTKMSTGYSESAEDVLSRVKNLDAQRLGITPEELEAREKQAKDNGEPLAVLSARINEAKTLGITIEEYEEEHKRQARRRRRIGRKAGELGITIEQMEERRRAEAARKGINVDELERQIEDEETAQHALNDENEKRDELYTDPTTIANTATNTGAPGTEAGSTTGLIGPAVKAAMHSDMPLPNDLQPPDRDPTTPHGAKKLMNKLGEALETPNIGPHKPDYKPDDPVASQDPTHGLATAGASAIPPTAHQHPATSTLANDDAFWEMIDRRAAEHRREHGCGISFCNTRRTDIPLQFTPFQRNPYNLHPTADVRLTRKVEGEEAGKKKGSKAQIRENGREDFGLRKVPGGKGQRRWTDKKAKALGYDRDTIKAKVAESGGTLGDYGLREDDEPEEIDLRSVDFGKEYNQ